MATMQTNELTGAALNFVVELIERGMVCHTVKDEPVLLGRIREFSTDWAQGGPIIEREEVELDRYWNRARTHESAWKARCGTRVAYSFGPSPLIAAMRCYVASKLGDTVNIPDELAG